MADGWLDGRGLAPGRVRLDWIEDLLVRHYNQHQLPLLCLYPTPGGGLQAEWSLPPHEVSLDIDLINHRGEWHDLNLDILAVDARQLNLDDECVWAWIVEAVECKARGAV